MNTLIAYYPGTNALDNSTIINNAVMNITSSARVTIDIDTYNAWKQRNATRNTNERTAKQYAKIVWYFVSWLNSIGVDKPTEEHINGYKILLLEKHAPATVQNYMVAISLFFKWLNKINVYPDITVDVKKPKVDHTYFKHDYLTEDELLALFQSIDTNTLTGKRDYAMLLLMACTGLRTVEISNARIKDIIKHGNEYRLYVMGKGDNGTSTEYADRTQYVVLTKEMYEAIADYLTAREPGSKTEPLFISISNRTKYTVSAMDTRSIRRVVTYYFNKIGINDDMHTAHSLRHTAGTLARKNGATLEQTAQMLRHKSVNTTRIYDHTLNRENNHSESLVYSAIFK